MGGTQRAPALHMLCCAAHAAWQRLWRPPATDKYHLKIKPEAQTDKHRSKINPDTHLIHDDDLVLIRLVVLKEPGCNGRENERMFVACVGVRRSAGVGVGGRPSC